MISVVSEELEQVLISIEDALVWHELWREDLLRTLACRLAPKPDDMADDAHRRCGFGIWYHGKANASFRELPDFRGFEELHKAVHLSARDICVKAKSQGGLEEEDYDRFYGSVLCFRESIHDLRRRLLLTLKQIDVLTGAFNQSLLLPHLRAVRRELKENGMPCSLLLLNFDLKKINGIHGRHLGDLALRKVIHSVKAELGSRERIYRYAGAEFIICLPGRSEVDAELFMDMLLNKIDAGQTEATGALKEGMNIRYGILSLDPDVNLDEQLNNLERSAHPVNR